MNDKNKFKKKHVSQSGVPQNVPSLLRFRAQVRLVRGNEQGLQHGQLQVVPRLRQHTEHAVLIFSSARGTIEQVPCHGGRLLFSRPAPRYFTQLPP